MLSIKLINLYNNIFALANYSVMSLITSFVTLFSAIVSMLFAPTPFIKHKNLVLKLLCLAIGSYMTTDSTLTIQIYN